VQLDGRTLKTPSRRELLVSREKKRTSDVLCQKYSFTSEQALRIAEWCRFVSLFFQYPSRPLAAAAALEWDAQGGPPGIQPTAMPVVAMCVTAIDNITDKNEPRIREEVMKYLPTDSVCFYDKADKVLYKRQRKHWRPLQKWVEKEYGHKLDVVDGIEATNHPEELHVLMQADVDAMDTWQLTGLQTMTMEFKSLVISMAMLKKVRDSTAQYGIV
jgi:chaperone required for assembly of F1-ATPase